MTDTTMNQLQRPPRVAFELPDQDKEILRMIAQKRRANVSTTLRQIISEEAERIGLSTDIPTSLV